MRWFGDSGEEEREKVVVGKDGDGDRVGVGDECGWMGEEGEEEEKREGRIYLFD